MGEAWELRIKTVTEKANELQVTLCISQKSEEFPELTVDGGMWEHRGTKPDSVFVCRPS